MTADRIRELERQIDGLSDVVAELERQIQELHARADDYGDVLIESEARQERFVEMRDEVLRLRQGIAEVRDILQNPNPDLWPVAFRAAAALGELLSADAWMADTPSEDGGQTFDVFPEKP